MGSSSREGLLGGGITGLGRAATRYAVPAGSLHPRSDRLRKCIGPGEQIVDPSLVVRGHVRQPAERVLQIPLRVEPVLLRRLHKAVDDRACPCPPRRVREQPVLPADYERLDRTFRRVVVELEVPVLQKCRELRPLPKAVANRPSALLGSTSCLRALSQSTNFVSIAWLSFPRTRLRSSGSESRITYSVCESDDFRAFFRPQAVDLGLSSV